MDRFLVDSWAWIEYFDGTASGRDLYELTLREDVLLFTSIINEYEVFAKVLRKKGRQAAEEMLDFIEANAKLEPLSRELVQRAAELKVTSGLAMADSIVAATAEKYNATVLTGDPDFRSVKGIKVKMLK